MKNYILLLYVFLTWCRIFSQENKPPKNVIILIGDGMGFEHINVAKYFEDCRDECFENYFNVKLAASTFPGKLETTPNKGYSSYDYINNWEYVKDGFTESAAAGTAIATGIKTRVDQIGLDVFQNPLLNMVQIAKLNKKSAGVVTSVPISHATPAAFLAHNISRKNYSEIAREIILHSKADVVMGAGHPLYDNDGLPANQPDYQYVGGKEIWEQLNKSATAFLINNQLFNLQSCDDDSIPDAWTLSDQRSLISAIVKKEIKDMPKRLLFVAPVFKTLSQERSGTSKHPFDIPVNENIPSLEEMTLASLELLSNDEDGFFLMIEGGAIDWAAHKNDIVRLIEEQIYFTKTIKSVIKWLKEKNMLDETLVVVLADHESGYLTGGLDENNKILPIVNKGKNIVPDVKFLSNDHTNQLVPFLATGACSDEFLFLAKNFDEKHGYYLDITDVAALIKTKWMVKPVVYPELSFINKNQKVTLSVAVPFKVDSFQWFVNNKPLQNSNKSSIEILAQENVEIYCLIKAASKEYKSTSSKIIIKK